jgi:predicted acyltransferase
MEELQKRQRLISLDAFRGITIAGMILVNNPGSWRYIYPPLGHARWHGWTPTDFIFPFFLFIVGVAIVYAFSSRLSDPGTARLSLYLKIFKRTVLLFVIGLYLSAFKAIPPMMLKIAGALLVLAILFYNLFKYTHLANREKWLRVTKWIMSGLALLLAASALKGVDWQHLRIPGVLQRIAITYCIAALIFLHTNVRWQIILSILFLVIYWGLMKLVPVPGYGAGMLDLIIDPVTNQPSMGNLAWYIDSKLLAGHTWSGAPAPGFDPEGILSTIPAISTVLFGVITAHWLRTKRSDEEKVNGLFVFGFFGVVLGEILSIWFPINKNLWSPSYTIFMGGLALLFLGVFYWLIDIKGCRRPFYPFIVFGSNALAVYAASSLFARMLVFWLKVPGPDGSPIALKTCLYQNYFEPYFSPYNASLAYAICYVLIWYGFVWVLYKKRIFIKV